MTFFDSDLVRKEMTDIQELQEEIYGSVFNFPQMDNEEKEEHIDLLMELLEKQRILYARMSLSDDPQAKKMKENIQESAVMMGMPKDVDMANVFSNMEKMIGIMKQQVDNSSLNIIIFRYKQAKSQNKSQIYVFFKPKETVFSWIADLQTS